MEPDHSQIAPMLEPNNLAHGHLPKGLLGGDLIGRGEDRTVQLQQDVRQRRPGCPAD